MDFVVYSYLIVVYIIPIMAVFLVPPMLAITNIYKANRYRQSFKKQLVVEYAVPDGLSPSVIGYIYDDDVQAKELLAELYYLQYNQPVHSYQILLKNMVAERPDITRKLVVDDPEDVEKNDVIVAFHDTLNDSLSATGIVDSSSLFSYDERSARTRKKAFRISRYSVLYPLGTIVLLNTIFSLFDTEVEGAEGGMYMILLLVIVHLIHAGILYVVLMLWQHAHDGAKIKSIGTGRQIKRTTWDEVRGYREYLKRVEAPKLSKRIELHETAELQDSKIPYLLSLGLVSKRDLHNLFKEEQLI